MGKEGRNAFLREITQMASKVGVFVFPVLLGSGLLVFSGCTQPLSGSFRFQQQRESFASTSEINTKIDILWVVDNSASMDVAQKKLRAGAVAFAEKYMQSTWDIRTAVITTDLYLAHNAFDSYMSTPVRDDMTGPNRNTSPYIAATFTAGWSCAHCSDLITGLINATGSTFIPQLDMWHIVPAWRPQGAQITAGRFSAGAKYSYLLPGLHDGPIAGLCFESVPYFFHDGSEPKCQLRDAPAVSRDRTTAIDNCLGDAANSIKNCVNTVTNDSVHSGTPIINTKNAASATQLKKDFRINLSVGTVGGGSERGLGSLLQFLEDNERNAATRFFRQDSVRAIVFITDEDDQTMEDGLHLVGSLSTDPYVDNPTPLTPLVGASRLWNNYRKGTCNGRSIGGVGVQALTKCVDNTTKLLAPSVVKGRLDRFFCLLDNQGTPTCGSAANYFITTITPLTAATVGSLQASRTATDNAVGQENEIATDRGQRYIELGNLVGNGSSVGEITSEDYTTILTGIGQSVIKKRGVFLLKRPPLSSEDTVVQIIHSDGTIIDVAREDFTIDGNTLTITNVEDVLLKMRYDDAIFVDYQPKTQF